MAVSGKLLWNERVWTRNAYGRQMDTLEVPLELPDGWRDWTPEEKMEAHEKIIGAVERLPSLGNLHTGLRGPDGRGLTGCRWEVNRAKRADGTVYRQIFLFGDNPKVVVRPLPLD
jgi:hypothetical protein